MIDFKRKIAVGLATGALLANAFSPLAFAGTTITISGNGSNSDNDANVDQDQSTNVDQTNKAYVNNNVNVDADTGDNDANNNTGNGEVTIDTGNASANVTVSNVLNANKANVDCCPTGDTEIKISDNGANSNNDVNLDRNSDINIDQYNKARVNNDVNVDAETGENNANGNTGDGGVSITTGNAKTDVSLSTTANFNSATVGGDNGDNGGTLSLWITGNGSNSDNDINVDLDSDVNIDQDNKAYIDNDVNVDADTGDNDANNNTGDGDVVIDTGDAKADVTVDNLVNFNHADADCGCPFVDDLTVKVADNGADSNNDVNVDLNSDLNVDQYNKAKVNNDVNVDDVETGNNDASGNTSGGDGDPSITTGDAEANVDLSTSGNVNSYGADGPDWDFPDFDLNGLSLSISFDLSDLLDALGL